jgi:hypothetical protein
MTIQTLSDGVWIDGRNAIQALRKQTTAWAQGYICNLLRESLRTKVITEPCLIIYMAESFLLSQILHQ